MVIPLPHNKMTRLGRNNVSATDPEITTYLLNMEEYSHNRDLISRTHCELWFDKDTGKLMIRDGGRSAETGVYKPSVNGTSVQGILLPFEGETELREGYTIELGAHTSARAGATTHLSRTNSCTESRQKSPSALARRIRRSVGR